jgi:hypothetical protein
MTPDELKAEFEKLHARMDNTVATVKAAPPWKLYAIGAVLVLVIIYLAWAMWGKRPQKPADGFIDMKPVVKEPKVAGPTVAVKKVPKKAVANKFPNAPIKGDEDGDGQDEEEWVNTSDVPVAPNGGTVLTKIDVKTGEVTDSFQANKAPWFAFERNNTVGAGYELGSQGTKIPVYYRRDFIRVKDIHVVGEIGAKLALDPKYDSEAYGRAGLEYRW